MKSNSGSQSPPTRLVIGAVIMVVLPLLLGLGLISWLIMNRNAQPEALPTLVSTQAQLPSAAEIPAQTPSAPAAAETATPAQNVSPLTPITSATASTEDPTGTAAPQITATAVPTSIGGSLATATQTSLPPTANSGGTVTPTATQTGNSTSTATVTATATQPGAGIVVSTPRWYFDSELNLVRVVGEVTNNTGTQQLIETVAGIFYSAPGAQVNENNLIEFAPQEVIPVGGTVPFYFELDTITSLSSFTVTVTTDQSPFTTRTDLILQDQSERTDNAAQRCFDGRIRNPGERLQNEIVVTASIYDEQNNLVNFEYQMFSGAPAFEVFGDRLRNYSICVRSPHTGRADVRAYGR